MLSELAQTSRAAVRSAATSVLEALAQLMAPAAYFLALASLMEGARSSVCRRALTLFCKKLARMGASGASATAAGQGMGKDGEGEEAVRDAVCAVCSHLPAMLESSEEGNLSTKQQVRARTKALASPQSRVCMIRLRVRPHKTQPTPLQGSYRLQATRVKYDHALTICQGIRRVILGHTQLDVRVA